MLKLVRKLQVSSREGVQSGQLQAQKGQGDWGLAGAQEHCFVPLPFISCSGCFSTFHHIKQTSQRPASLGLQSLLCSLDCAFRLCERAHLTSSGTFSCPGCLPHMPSCVFQCPLELFAIKDELKHNDELKQINAWGPEEPSTFSACSTVDLCKVPRFQRARTKLIFGDDF